MAKFSMASYCCRASCATQLAGPPTDEDDMETPKAPSNLEPTSVESLPEEPVAEDDAEDVKGGGIRRAQLAEIDAQSMIRER